MKDPEIMGRVRSFTRQEIEAAGGVLNYLDDVPMVEVRIPPDPTERVETKPAKRLELKQNEKAMSITDSGAELYHRLTKLGDSPELTEAKQKLNDLVKLAVKHITNA